MKFRSILLAGFLFLAPFVSSFAQVGISVNFAPPVLPVYEQPLCPVAGYIWTPGYWAWDNDYYWVPGAWVPPPRVGLLWTPPWWGWSNGAYVFNQGYWGPNVGFYGGINYGYGYTGNGYWGGRWSGNTFQYNTAVTRVNTTVVRNTYVNNSFTKNVNATRTSFNGPNGVKAEPTAQQKAAAANAKKMGPTSQQLTRQQAASKDQNLRASVNKGNPNADAIKSFNKSEGVGHGKGGEQGLGAATEAGSAKGENKIGGASELNRQGAGAGQGQGAKGLGTAAGAGAEKAENKPGDVAEHHGPGAGMNAEEHGNKHAAENQGNKRNVENLRGNKQNVQGNQAKMRTGKGAQRGGPGAEPHAMNQQMSRTPKMGAQQHPQGGGKHPQTRGGGNRPPQPPKQQQQGKKKQGKPDR
jgi:WXXGXW repeat (2 copies)